jgi:hypothetical protein
MPEQELSQFFSKDEMEMINKTYEGPTKNFLLHSDT